MVLLKDRAGEIEIRIMKPPFDAADPEFFDEYANLGVRDPGRNACTRYITPESQTYAIHVVVKSGYNWGKYTQMYIEVSDKATEKQLFECWHRKKKCEGSISTNDQVFAHSTVDYAAVDGKPRRAVQLAFKNIIPDENLVLETDAPGCDPNGLAGLLIKVRRSLESGIRPMNEKEWKKDLGLYDDLIAARETGSKLISSLNKAEKVDQKSFIKYGVTHNLSLIGGENSDIVYPDRMCQGMEMSRDCAEVTFICRTPDFFEEQSIAKMPIPQECYLWVCLRERERRDCFKQLQEYDKEHTLKHRIALAGMGADTEAIERQLFEIEEIPNRWRSWAKLEPREKEPCFRELQTRRNFFAKGAVPPEDLPPSKPSSKNQPSGRKVSEAIEVVDAVESAADAVKIKQEPQEAPSAVHNSNAQVEVVDLCDSPPPSPRRGNANATLQKQTTIKVEPVDVNDISKRVASTGDVDDADRQSKKIKLEPGAFAYPLLDESDLLRLKEEDEELQEEVAAAKRLTELLKERKEKKARILAIEQAKRKGTPLSK